MNLKQYRRQAIVELDSELKFGLDEIMTKVTTMSSKESVLRATAEAYELKERLAISLLMARSSFNPPFEFFRSEFCPCCKIYDKAFCPLKKELCSENCIREWRELRNSDTALKFLKAFDNLKKRIDSTYAEYHDALVEPEPDINEEAWAKARGEAQLDLLGTGVLSCYGLIPPDKKGERG